MFTKPPGEADLFCSTWLVHPSHSLLGFLISIPNSPKAVIMNAGLGLGLPSTFTANAHTSGRSMSSKTVVPEDPQHADFLFPLPNFRGRNASAETYRIRDLQSYWSPDTEAEAEDYEEEDDFDGPVTGLVQQGEDGLLSPLQLAAHACLHLLSPKGDALGRAAASGGLAAEEALVNALDFAWLVPMVGKSPSL